MTLDPFQSLDSFTIPDASDPRAYPALSQGDRILALDTLLSAACAFQANGWRSIRRVEEAAMKFAEKKYVGAYLRAFLATEKESLEGADGSPSTCGALAAKLALALLLLSSYRDEIGALERLESFLDDEGCPRPDVRRAIREVLCGRNSAWDVLGLDPGASGEEIKKAYRSLSRSLHPDATSGMDMGERTRREEEFRRANEAYELLITVTPSSPGLPPVRSSRRFP